MEKKLLNDLENLFQVSDFDCSNTINDIIKSYHVVSVRHLKEMEQMFKKVLEKKQFLYSNFQFSEALQGL